MLHTLRTHVRTYGQTNRQTRKQTERQRDGQTDERTDRQTDGTHRYIETYIYIHTHMYSIVCLQYEQAVLFPLNQSTMTCFPEGPSLSPAEAHLVREKCRQGPEQQDGTNLASYL